MLVHLAVDAAVVPLTFLSSFALGKRLSIAAAAVGLVVVADVVFGIQPSFYMRLILSRVSFPILLFLSAA